MAQRQPGIAKLRPTTPGDAPLPVPTTSRSGDSYTPSSSYKTGHLNLDTFSPVNQNGSFEFDRVLRRGKVSRRIKKKGAWKPSWKPSYLVLRPNLLSMYNSPDETDLSASITLSDVTAVAPVKKANMENVFGVFSPAKNHHFQGLSARDTSDWIEVIRAEAQVDLQDDIGLRSPRIPLESRDSHGYESTDASGDDELVPPGSPETPHWPVSSQKSRSRANTGQRQSSRLYEYSGNEMVTSHSDFSDALSSAAIPKSVAGSAPKASALTPIVSGQQNVRPIMGRQSSQLSGAEIPITTTNTNIDPDRVIHQGWLHCLKSKGGVKQWKTLWTVLRPRNLSFYKTAQEYSAIKILSMSSIINAAEIDPVSKSKQFCFQIIVERKTYRLCAPDDDGLARWLGALKSVLARRRNVENSLVDGAAALSVR